MPLNMQDDLPEMYICRRKSCLVEMEGGYFSEKEELKNFLHCLMN